MGHQESSAKTEDLKMNTRYIIQSRRALEQYLLTRLKEVFWEFPSDITPTTTFKNLNKSADLDLIDFGFVIDIEDDLGIEFTEQHAEVFDKQDVATVIAWIAEELRW
jgi:hypothetical protein